MPVARFSEHAHEYDEHTPVQKKCADYLTKLIIQNTKHPKKVCDIGCGTGSLGRRLRDSFREIHLTCCDTSAKMLEEAQKKIPKSTFIHGTLPEDNGYDLIMSNFAFQWIENLPDLLEECMQKLTYGGMLAFSLPVKGTFKELQEAAVSAEIEGKVFSYYDEKSLLNLSEDYECILSEVSIVEDIFPDTLSFLKELHLIGATLKNRQMSVGKLRKLIRAHDNYFEGKVKAEYRVLTALFKKDSK